MRRGKTWVTTIYLRKRNMFEPWRLISPTPYQEDLRGKRGQGFHIWLGVEMGRQHLRRCVPKSILSSFRCSKLIPKLYFGHIVVFWKSCTWLSRSPFGPESCKKRSLLSEHSKNFNYVQPRLLVVIFRFVLVFLSRLFSLESLRRTNTISNWNSGVVLNFRPMSGCLLSGFEDLIGNSNFQWRQKHLWKGLQYQHRSI